jgi:SAM-dependent methyltransferase
MYDFHKNNQWYYEMQTLNAEKYVLPFIEEKMPIKEGMYVLEVGCAEGGVLKAFVRRGCYGVGVELDEPRLKNAIAYNQEMVDSGKMNLIAKNIYDASFESEFNQKFDLIILKDVIEHIHDQEKIMAQFKKFMKPGGHIFFGFPPIHMPFGGHQQIALSKIVAVLPFTHLLPMSLYKLFLKLCGEPATSIDGLLEIKETGITTARFESISKKEGYEFVHSRQYLFNPIYEFKFGLKPRIQFSFISAIPHLRDFMTTCAFYLLKK